MRLAAIDIGSNATRLLITDVKLYKDGTLDFTKVNLIRVPLRLGFDVFETNLIGEKKLHQFIETMQAYKHLLHVYEVLDYKAIATSAMRDAQNGQEVVDRIKAETGIAIQIISGSEEASILFETHFAESLEYKNDYLYIDVGGGSTELTLYSKNKIIAKQSFNIGTIRLLTDKVVEEEWKNMKNFVKIHTAKAINLSAIGSGGNINKIFSMSKYKLGKPLDYNIIKLYHKEMQSLSIDERIHKYGFKDDRADVIVPALQIYTSVMRWAEIDAIHVPQIGLVDGLIKQLYQKQSFTAMKGRKN